ncbi:hypothetical protein BpHYR1_025683 [Brachionus plicatilis]|uniref:Secreted protein n=1 Tax=Brachionus plicatilis TaxID=10195 RepID=A0A3M7SHJ9_BRAPC|nr:hypothetical protein BpHYR1_025683 [Brachionus plicatilis]
MNATAIEKIVHLVWSLFFLILSTKLRVVHKFGEINMFYLNAERFKVLLKLEIYAHCSTCDITSFYNT